jgi:hypothetical protein
MERKITFTGYIKFVTLGAVFSTSGGVPVAGFCKHKDGHSAMKTLHLEDYVFFEFPNFCTCVPFRNTNK